MTVLTESYREPAFCEREILRMAGCNAADDKTLALMRECIEEAKTAVTYKVCYGEFTAQVSDSSLNIGHLSFHSQKLAKNLEGCNRVIIFAASLGVGIDRLIAKYGRVSPSKALFFGAIGAERTEALCDAFCRDIENERSTRLTPRFSPGYGDLSLSAQRDIFALLNPEKNIGLTLTESLIMSPSKSVTAIVGLDAPHPWTIQDKCKTCNMKNCTFRGV